MIRKALPEDIAAIKAIADKNKDTLGFVMRSTLLESIARSWVLVAESDNQVVGFVNYRHRRDEQTTIYEICVAQDYRGKGMGQALLNVLVKESASRGKAFIQLKAIATIPANRFYERYGFTLVRVESGRRQSLNVWRFVVGTAPQANELTSLQPLLWIMGLEVV